MAAISPTVIDRPLFAGSSSGGKRRIALPKAALVFKREPKEET
jgi:hypothetical protein